MSYKKRYSEDMKNRAENAYTCARVNSVLLPIRKLSYLRWFWDDQTRGRDKRSNFDIEIVDLEKALKNSEVPDQGNSLMTASMTVTTTVLEG